MSVVSVVPEILHTLGVEVVKVTGPVPDPPPAKRETVAPNFILAAGEKAKVACAALPITRFTEVVATRYALSAAFVATTVQVPGAKPLTSLSTTEQIEGVVVEYVSAPVPDPPDTKKVPVVSTPRPAGIEAKTKLD
jgi:hypothetical protein